MMMPEAFTFTFTFTAGNRSQGYEGSYQEHFISEHVWRIVILVCLSAPLFPPMVHG